MTHPHVEYALNKVLGAYDEEELEAIRMRVAELAPHSHIVEIGILYGRTSSIYMQASREKPLNITLIDCFGVNGEDCEKAFAELRTHFPPVELLAMRAENAAPLVANNIDLLHIDGDHGVENITIDCQLYLPKLKSGAVAMFHDYHRPSPDGIVFPWLEEVVDEYTRGWENLGLYGTHAQRRKP